MNIAQLAYVVEPVVKRRDARPLGPAKVTALTATRRDSGYGLQELLRAVQEMAQGEFQGNEAARAEAMALAAALSADLARLGAGVEDLLRPAAFTDKPRHLDIKA